ncbi:CLUMA_CG015685, isoform A [Clunio marinus]|uniref:CLUMA_CG015685, isoform A n=1 Tax=Clunio marinus TaxID=568069 RepID=A0A1J1IS28_9DIPT|nr:CLUMA_CG015685, isoform A [Clunio marinus]
MTAKFIINDDKLQLSLNMFKMNTSNYVPHENHSNAIYNHKEKVKAIRQRLIFMINCIKKEEMWTTIYR